MSIACIVLQMYYFFANVDKISHDNNNNELKRRLTFETWGLINLKQLNFSRNVLTKFDEKLE